MCREEEETVAKLEDALVKARSEVEDRRKLIDHFHKEMLKMQQGEADNTFYIPRNDWHLTELYSVSRSFPSYLRGTEREGRENPHLRILTRVWRRYDDEVNMFVRR